MKRIVLVDLQPYVSEVLKMVFKEEFEVLRKDFKGAKEVLREDDLLILDMDDLSYEKLSFLNSFSKHVHPILVCSKNLNLGRFLTVKKPVNLKELIGRCKEVIYQIEERGDKGKVCQKFNINRLLFGEESWNRAKVAFKLGVPMLICGEDGCKANLFARNLHDLYGEGEYLEIYPSEFEKVVSKEKIDSPCTIFLNIYDPKPTKIEQKNMLLFLEDSDKTRFIFYSKDPIYDKSKDFIPDFFYKISTFTILIPPLRERKEDLFEIFKLFVKEKEKAIGLNISFSADLEQFVKDYNWPGNLAEMENIATKSVILSKKGLIDREVLISALVYPFIKSKIGKDDKDKIYYSKPSSNNFVKLREDKVVHMDNFGYEFSLKSRVLKGELSLKEAVDILEKDIIEEALVVSNFVQSRTAKLLGISRRILGYKMRLLNISVHKEKKIS